MSKKKYNLVRCKKCKKIVGADLEIKEIERCYSCHKGKKDTATSAAGPFSKVKKGPAADLPSPKNKISMRSSWERNFARWLCIKGLDWTFEEFDYPMKINPSTGKWYPRKPWGYLPDFLEVKSGTIWEVKGYFRSQDRSKVRRFKKHYPDDFKKLKVCLSKSNKKARSFYGKMGVPMVFIEDVKAEYKRLVKKKKRPDHWE